LAANYLSTAQVLGKHSASLFSFVVTANFWNINF